MRSRLNLTLTSWLMISIGVNVSVISCVNSEELKLPQALKGPYLGQKLPGVIPEPLAPGLVTTSGWEVGGVFSIDLKEFYFIRQQVDGDDQEIVVYRQEQDLWNASVFSSRVGTPLFSPDGKTLHLGNHYRTRNQSDWSELKELDQPFKDFPIMRLSSSQTGTYFFDEFKQDLSGDIRYSRLIDGKYEEPKRLDKSINAGKSFHPFIAPDESYLIFDGKREDSYGDSDLYISYRLSNGTWGNPINLGEKINTAGWEALASVTSDGKFLVFNRNMTPKNYENVDIFWVDAEFIERLRPKQ